MHRALLGLVFASCKTSIHHIHVNKGRFKCQALLDEQAILSCMVYVDLNPVRADICKTLETSEHTSIKQRIEQITQTKIANRTATVKLSSFIGSSLKKDGIAFALKDYLELADWTGRMVRDDKRGFIKNHTPGILQKLELDEHIWMETLHGYSKGFYSFVGPEVQLKALCQNQKKHWVRGINACRKLFKSNHPIPITT